MRFLIAYRRSEGRILEREDFADADIDRAWALRDAWNAKYLGDSDVEVVLLGARSEATLLATHSRYFRTVQEILAAG